MIHGLLFGLWVFGTASTADTKIEPEALITAHCSGCHSLALVTSQRGNARYWEETIRWMQRTQNLWEIPADQERAIIDHLSRAFSEEDDGRRPQLPPHLRFDKRRPD